MIDAGQLRKGIAIELEGKIYQVVEYTHIKMGEVRAGEAAPPRVRGGGMVERAFQATERFEPAFLEHARCVPLRRRRCLYNVMGPESYEQYECRLNRSATA